LLTSGFLLTNLVSDLPGLALHLDRSLVNPWGISFAPEGPFWLSDAGTGASGVFAGNGATLSMVGVPGPQGSMGSPTGTVFNDTSGFAVTENGRTGSSLFLFAGQDGSISGWSPDVDLLHAVIAIDPSTTWSGGGPADFKGLALGQNDQGTFLFATDFHGGQIDVFDSGFRPAWLTGSFTDPNMPEGFAPFNIQNIAGNLFVTYAKQGTDGYSQATGAGNGFVDEFDTNGNFIRRFASQGVLDTPWGMALAPDDFGRFSNALLIANFGDGRINAFDPKSGAFLGALTDHAGQPIQVPGLWALSFGNGHGAGREDILYFTAGIANQHHGLFGMIQATPVAPDTSDGSSYDSSVSAADGHDKYPLPPLTGPELGNTFTAQPGLAAVLLPTSSGPLGMVPALLSVSGNRTSADGTLIAASDPAQIASLLGTKTASNTAEAPGGSAGMDGINSGTKTLAYEVFLSASALKAERTPSSDSEQGSGSTLTVDNFQPAKISQSNLGGEIDLPARPGGMIVTPLGGPSTTANQAGETATGASAAQGDNSRVASAGWWRGVAQPLAVVLLWSGVGLVWRRRTGSVLGLRRPITPSDH
jgi:uncharacterized protein (TIGR03118 family)